jgi:hypothetical protein
MIYIPVAAPFTAVLRIADSISTNLVSYQILRASDSSVFASGSPTWLGSSLWSVIFTPTVADETYVLTIDNATLDVQVSESYKATVADQVAVAQSSGTSAAELLLKVNAAISKILNGGAVQSYMIGGKNVMYMSLDQLKRLRDDLRKEVSSGQTGTRLFATFGNPS